MMQRLSTLALLVIAVAAVALTVQAYTDDDAPTPIVVEVSVPALEPVPVNITAPITIVNEVEPFPVEDDRGCPLADTERWVTPLGTVTTVWLPRIPVRLGDYPALDALGECGVIGGGGGGARRGIPGADDGGGGSHRDQHVAAARPRADGGADAGGAEGSTG